MDGFRRFIIKTAEIMMILIVVLMTISFAISGAGSAAAMGGSYWILGLLLGAVGGFLFSAVLAAYFFLLLEVAENTRRIP